MNKPANCCGCTHTHTHHAFYQMQTLVKFAKACLLYSKIENKKDRNGVKTISIFLTLKRLILKNYT